MKQIKQLQITSANETKNQLAGLSVYQIGIQAPQGTQFKLNNGGIIHIGKTGIYELDVTDIGVLDSLIVIQLENGATMYVDIVCDEIQQGGIGI